MWSGAVMNQNIHFEFAMVEENITSKKGLL